MSLSVVTSSVATSCAVESCDGSMVDLFLRDYGRQRSFSEGSSDFKRSGFRVGDRWMCTVCVIVDMSGRAYGTSVFLRMALVVGEVARVRAIVLYVSWEHMRRSEMFSVMCTMVREAQMSSSGNSLVYKVCFFFVCSECSCVADIW